MKKLVNYVTTLIISIGRNMKLMTTLNLCLTTLKKRGNRFVKGNSIFIFHIMSERGELFRAKVS